MPVCGTCHSRWIVYWFRLQTAFAVVLVAMGLTLTAWRPQRLFVGGTNLEIIFQGYWPGFLLAFTSSIGLSIVSTLYKRNAQFCLVGAHEILVVLSALALLGMGIAVTVAVSNMIALGLENCRSLNSRDGEYYLTYGPSCLCNEAIGRGYVSTNWSGATEFIFRDDCEDVLGKIADFLIAESCVILLSFFVAVVSSLLGCSMFPYAASQAREQPCDTQTEMSRQ
eukprot:m.905 g.905  ORF g.905 m.905 type:complete len:224 (+) comp5118_c0_seq1:42-713(+)